MLARIGADGVFHTHSAKIVLNRALAAAINGECEATAIFRGVILAPAATATASATLARLLLSLKRDCVHMLL